MPQPDDEDMGVLGAMRAAETREAEARVTDSFEAYWQGSASASVMRDYAAGRVVSVGRSAPKRRRRR
jgi:hypothetical protein